MGRLHMKETPAEREEEEERAYRKAKKAARKARRLHTDCSDSSSSKHKRKRSRSPSYRHKKRRDSVPLFEEEEWVPPASTSKVDMNALREEMEERQFRDKLFDAMGDDAGFENIETRFNEYDDAVPDRWKGSASSHLRNDPSMMDDDQYAEWIREGMWRRTHKAEVEAQERAEEERKRKKEREKARREETRRMEREDSERRGGSMGSVASFRNYKFAIHRSTVALLSPTSVTPGPGRTVKANDFIVPVVAFTFDRETEETAIT